jgi:glycogen debranching enzyme
MTSALPATDHPVPLIEAARMRSLELLRRNPTPEGILASSSSPQADGRHYTSIFGRDAAICALGMFVSGEADLVEGGRQGLRTLARHQALNGQIPKYVKPLKGEVDFWYTGCIDATLWWLIAVRLHDRLIAEGNLGGELDVQVERAMRWLHCQEHQVWHLLQQNEASDWADIMPRSGFVLYTNALWYWTKRLYGLPCEATRDYANHLFSPFGCTVPEQRRARLMTHYIRNKARRTDLYLSFVNFSFWGEEVDVFGNLLTALTGVADPSRAVSMVEALSTLGVHRPWPVRVVGHPIGRRDPLWRHYMQRHKQNLPFQYHNGGAWPFVGAFWVLLHARLGRTKEAWRELERLAGACSAGDWEFNEWFHGTTGEAMGMPGQSWNAALFLLAHRALSGPMRIWE